VIYDLLPINLPSTDIVAGGKAWFEQWIRSAIEESDNLLCISRTVADELITYIRMHKLERTGLQVGYWHLGSIIPTAMGRLAAATALDVARPYALMVGTIEPRKNHLLALQAFEFLWEKGLNLSLVIAGRKGWLVDDLMERLRSHRAIGKTLFLFEEINDDKLSDIYRQAEVVLFLSKGEGFGLPLVESANYGTPIICSDIPIFHEIAEDHATFVKIDDPIMLAADIEKWQILSAAKEVPFSAGMKRLTWKQSTESMIDVVIGNNWYWKA
jgi:glycosyltransferase involved in cell wall biosynthesis